MSQRLETTRVGDIVAGDFRAAGVFDRFGIDFCCDGRRSLAEACHDVSADPATVIRALDALPSEGAVEDDVAIWPLDRLIDHIVAKHHAYVRSSAPMIARDLATLTEVHGARHPELFRVASGFGQVRVELEQHLMKEEQILFPYVRELAAAGGEGRFASPFGTVGNPIRMMEREHREAADALRAIGALTGGYRVPDDGCTTYRVCMAELARFEQDLHRHVHLENNILFPKAIELEQR